MVDKNTMIVFKLYLPGKETFSLRFLSTNFILLYAAHTIAIVTAAKKKLNARELFKYAHNH